MSRTPDVPADRLLDVDVFVSYAVEDLCDARGACSRMANLRTYLHDPEQRSPSGLAELFLERTRALLTSLVGTSRPPVPATVRRTDHQVEQELSAALDRSRALLVIWSSSHRGSRWANFELDYFRTVRPDRPVYVLQLDSAPPVPAKWIHVGPDLELTDARISIDTACRSSSSSHLSGTKLPTVGDARAWVAQAAEWGAGTSYPELVRLMQVATQAPPEKMSKARVAPETARAFVSSVRSALWWVLVGTASACAAGVWLVLNLRGAQQPARHCVLVLVSVWTYMAFVGLQASVASVLPAAIVGCVMGLCGQVLATALSNYQDGGVAAGLAAGGFIGTVTTYEWTLHRRTIRGPGAARDRLRWIVRSSAGGAVFALLVALATVVLLRRDSGYFRGKQALGVALLIATLPVAGIWLQVARLVRVRECLRRAMAPAAFVAVGLVSIGVLSSTGWLSVDHQTVRSGIVAGAVAGLCVTDAYLAPGLFFGLRVASEARALSAAVGATLTLAGLVFLVPTLDPINQMNGEWVPIFASYGCAALAAAIASRGYIWFRDRSRCPRSSVVTP